MNPTLETTHPSAELESEPHRRRIHPLARLDFIVRLAGCPIAAGLVISGRMSAAEPIPPGVWIGLAIYALIWPHVAFFLVRRKRDVRRMEMRFLVVDVAAIGASIALISFQSMASMALVTGCATILSSVGGIPLLLSGMAAMLISMFLTAWTVTDFAVTQSTSMFGTVLAAAALLGFQTMMGILTYRTARNFVTSRRRIAEQSEEIQTQNEALMRAREEALLAAQAKAAFLATMSHEIRTPLNGVLGMTRLLADTRLTPDQQDFVRTIQVSGTTLLTVINDILDYSRIESGRMELEEEPLRVREVVEEVLEIVADRARQNGIELICEIAPDVPTAILGDITRVRQVLTNLVGNAVKFTERGEVVVNVRRAHAAEARQTPAIEIAVSDTGIGIPEDRIPILFSAFSQADASTTRRYGGTGLGLAISRRLTELMGGTVSVRSAVGTGSTFTVTIPAPLAEEVPETVRGEPASLIGKRVLVVDDNATNRRVLCAQLEAWGMTPVSADGAGEALQALAGENEFGLAILDLHMPDVDGLTLARSIRHDGRHEDLPLVLLSSSLVQKKDDPERLFRLRLMKPVRQSRLFDSIMQVVEGRASESPGRTEPGLQPVPLYTPLNILVADDNETNRNVATLVFRRFGYEVDLVVNGRDAIDRVVRRASGSDAYDLVFMDVHMPDVDGLEATRQLRTLATAQPEKRWPRIVAMTADAMPEDREICLAAGMDDYLTKPLDFDAIQAVLAHSAATTSAERQSNPRELVSEEPQDDVAPIALTPREIEEPDAPPAVMDWSRLSELRIYDTPEETMVKGAIAAFVVQSASRLTTLRSSAMVLDAPALRASAHGLKGAAMNIGATAVADCSTRLEQAAKNNTLDGVNSLIDTLTSHMVQTLVELHQAPDRLRETAELQRGRETE